MRAGPEAPPRLLPWVAGGLAFGAYCSTLAPSLTFIDAGELAAVAYTFGIAHPTGYPLFTLLAGLWARLPLGHGVLRLNLFAAFSSAAAVFVLTRVLWLCLPRADEGRGAPQPDAPDLFARGAAAATGALCIGFARTFWSNALSVEVYSLHALMLALVLEALLRVPGGGSEPATGRLRLFAFVLGLSFSNHLTTVQLLPGVALVLFATLGFERRSLRALVDMLPPFAAGLLPYVYLPLRAAAHPPLDWGDPSTLGRLLDHVLARQYQGRFFLGIGAFAAYLRYFVRGFGAELGFAPLPLLMIGAVVAWKRDRRLALLLLVLFLTSVAVASSYAITDIDSYYLLAYLSAGLASGVGLHALLRWLGPSRRPLSLLAIAGVLGTVVTSNGPAVSERGDHLIEDYARNMFLSLKPGALVLSYQWDLWISPSYYYQLVEGVRPDVTVVDKRLLQHAWYLEQVWRRHPQVFSSVASERRAVLELARAGRASAAGHEALQRAVEALATRLVDTQIDARPVYVTVDVEAAFAPAYKQIPEGLVLRLYRPDRMPKLADPVFDAFAYRPFGRRDRWTDQLRGVYATMLMARGALLEENGLPREARRYFERALAFEPVGPVREAILERMRASPRTAP